MKPSLTRNAEAFPEAIHLSLFIKRMTSFNLEDSFRRTKHVLSDTISYGRTRCCPSTVEMKKFNKHLKLLFLLEKESPFRTGHRTAMFSTNE